MKIITSLLGIVALTFVSSALAQEESPSASPEHFYHHDRARSSSANTVGRA